MKKASKFARKLVLKKQNLVLLNANASKLILAGDDTIPQKNSYACVPPFNAPPYFYPDKP